jgi:hypothetical protein
LAVDKTAINTKGENTLQNNIINAISSGIFNGKIKNVDVTSISTKSDIDLFQIDILLEAS